jgi:hypothetical protein
VEVGARRGRGVHCKKFGTTHRQVAAPREQAKLVPQIIKAMQAKSDWDNEEFLGASVVSEDWEPVRNEYTGVLVELRVTAALDRAAEEGDLEGGRCRLFTMGVRQGSGGRLAVLRVDRRLDAVPVQQRAEVSGAGRPARYSTGRGHQVEVVAAGAVRA